MQKYKDKKIYDQAKKIIDNQYQRHSAYKSMALIKKYKQLGGELQGPKTQNLDAWQKEKWIQVKPFVQNKKRITCGKNDNKKACRPSVKVNDKTATLLQDLIKKHGKQKMLELADIKQKNMNVRINWNKGIKY